MAAVGVIMLLVSALLQGTSAAVITGSITPPQGDWVYLGKFCFTYSTSPGGPFGYINGTVTTPMDDLFLYFYDDQATSFPAIRNPSVTCEEKISVNHIDNNGALAIPMSTDGSSFSFHYPIVEHLEDRFWYVAAASAQCQYDVSISNFQLTFINPGGSQFGVDQEGVSTMYSVFTFLYIAGLVLHLYGHCKRDFFPPPVKVASIAYVMKTISVTGLSMHWVAYGANGVGMPFIETLARILDLLSLLALWLCCGMIASGLEIVSTDYSFSAQKGNVICLAVITLAFFIESIWYEVGRSPWSTTIVFDSAFGIITLILTLFYGGYCVMRMLHIRSLAASPDLRTFMLRAIIVFVCSFLVLPLVVVVGDAVPATARVRVVDSLLTCTSFGVFAALAVMLFPTNAQKVLLAQQQDLHKAADLLQEDVYSAL